MQITHVTCTIAEEAAGVSYSVVRLCAALSAQGHDVTLATLDSLPVPSQPPFLKTFKPGWGPRRLGLSSAMRRWLNEQAVSRTVELIHAHSLWKMPNVYPGAVARRHGIPLVVSPRGTMSGWAMQNGSFAKPIFWRLVQRPALAAAACFHATAESEHEDIRRLGFHQPVAVIPNGIDLRDPVPKQVCNSRTLLFLGRIHAGKGLDMLLPAWRAVQDRFPHWSLHVVGPDDGGYLSKMKRLATELRLERVEFKGVLYGAQKWQAYGQADLFVLPTYSENFGLSVAEALSSGTPTIVTKGAPWPELEKRGAGWWIDITLDSLKGCLEAALSRSREDLEEMGRRGRRWMAEEYSWSRLGRQMAETYNWILQGGSTPGWVIRE